MNEKKVGGLAINNDVVAQIAKIATLEIEGVAGMATRPLDIKGVLAKDGLKPKSVVVTVKDGVLMLDVYIKLHDNVKIKSVAEAVQQNVKEKVQNMTSNAVAKVNVYVIDVAFADEIEDKDDSVEE